MERMGTSEDPQSSAAGSGGADDGRDETETERLDRHWTALLQELRVTQTGTQILGAFLLAIAFQSRFTELDAYQLLVYLVLVCTAAAATALGIAPVSLHRMLFRRHAMRQVVRIANVLVQVTLVLVAILLSGTVLLIFDFVVDRTAGGVAGGAVLLFIVTMWGVVPRAVRSGVTHPP